MHLNHLISRHNFHDSLRAYYVFARYLASSLITTGVDYLVFILFYTLTDKISIGIFAARIAAVSVQFALLRFAVFSQRHSFWFPLLKYIALVAVSGVLTSVFIYHLRVEFNVPVLFGKMIVEFLLYFLNYFLLKRFVFKLRYAGSPDNRFL